MPPTMILDALQGVRRRVRVLSFLSGLGILVATAVGLLLATVLLDYLLNIQAIPRFVLIVCAIVGIGYILINWLVRPLMAKLSLTDVAGRLENAFPQFDDRLRSTVNFVQAQVPGSDVMKDRVVTEATRMAQQVDLNRAIVMKPVWYSVAAGVGALLLVGVLVISVNDQYLRIALSRLFTPFNAQQWPKRVQIDLVGNVPTRVPVGQRVDLKMRLARGDRDSMRAVIVYQYDDGPVQQEYMNRNADGTYTASLDARAGDAEKGLGQLKVWMRSGDDQKDIPPITVVPRLAITHVEATITPPKYAQLEPTTVNLSNRPAMTTVGAQVALKVLFNKGLAEGKPVLIEPVNPDTKSPESNWSVASEYGVVGTWVAGDSLRFHIRATDLDGFQNSALEEYELIVRPDQSPTVQIENPRRNEERTTVATVPLQGVADDDYGISLLKLMVERLGDKKKWEISLVQSAAATGDAAWEKIESTGERQRFRLAHTWDLARLEGADLKPGDVLEYHLLVQDNFDLNGQTHAPVPSGKLRITIISQEQLSETLLIELRNIANQISDIRNNQNRTKEETGSLAKDTEKKPQLDAADRAAAERLANQQSTGASQAKQVAQKLENMLNRMDENKSPNEELKGIAGDVKNQLNQTAENPMKDAANQLNEAKDQKQAGDAEKRNESMKQAQTNQQAASDQLQKALDRMGNIGTLQTTIDSIKKLLDDQKKVSKETAEVGKNNLGKKPEDMSPEDKQKLDKAAQDQQNLSERTEKALQEMKKTSDTMQKSDPTSAEAMKRAAETGQQQQVSSNQSKASKATQQNQQSQAQSSQKQAELGLEMMLAELREAERRKLEELARKLEELQKQIEALVRRQAGHNLDNITLQGPDRVAKMDAKQLEELMQKANRVKDQLPPPAELPQLTTGQEQTERNTRDIGKSVEDLPNGSEPSAHLIRAAGKMERAIVLLREKKVPDAYEPPQIEALAALEDAKKLVDQMKNEVDEKREEQQRESVRQAYIQIKEEQEKLNKETVAIDGAPRGADGAFKREDVIRLGQLPGVQGGLSDRVKKLGEDLSSLGGLVYVWANKDIAGSMDQVKDDLGKQVTGKPTQAEQERIVEQLDAMIRSLKSEPNKSEFAQREGGGNGKGGQGTPGLPTEAELRLLKELQQAVNGSTKKINAEPQKDKPKLVALGERQGDLRDLLNKLLLKASEGQMKLGPEPDNKDQLPEEANEEDIEAQELDKELLTGEDAAKEVEKDMNLVGDRMARSRQRLALNNDPGKITQKIQDRIIFDLESLIKQAQQQQAQTQGQPKPQDGQAKGQPKPSPGAQADNQGQQNNPQPNNAQNPAAQSNMNNGGGAGGQSAEDIMEKMAEWGGITPRQRDAVIEGASEKVIEKYRKLVDDYYRSLATKSTER